jgi:hypothetical protein
MERPITKFDFDKLNVKHFHAELDGALQELAEKYGLKYNPASVRYSDNFFRTKLEFTVSTSEDGKDYSPQVEEWNRYASSVGLPVKWLGEKFKSPSGEELEIVGFKNRNRKDKVLLEDSAGKGFKASVSFVKHCMPEPEPMRFTVTRKA